MTAPTPVPVVPSKAKAWWALLIPQIPALALFVLQLAGSLPPPYGALFGALFSIVGGVSGAAVHQAKYLPTGTVVVPASTIPIATGNPEAAGGSYWPAS
jgi:hypothetical protein